MLEVRDLSISFGGLKAVEDVSLALKEGTIACLIGPMAPASRPCSR